MSRATIEQYADSAISEATIASELLGLGRSAEEHVRGAARAAVAQAYANAALALALVDHAEATEDAARR